VPTAARTVVRIAPTPSWPLRQPLRRENAMHTCFESRRIRRQRTTGRVAATAIALLLVAGLGLPAAAVAQGKDDLWEVTIKTEIPGMPMALPPVVTRNCTARNAKDEDYVPSEKNCRMQDRKRSGNRLSYTIVCEGKDAMTIAGEMTFGTNSYEGRMRMSGTANGQPMDMTQKFSGKRVGDCTAAAK
jgi:hypothetical protein